MDLDGLVQSKSASLIEDMNSDDPDSAARLNAQLIDSVTDDVIGQYNLAAPNFRELRRRYPRETEEFIVPILRDLQLQKVLAPDARVTSQVLQTEFKPTQEFSKKIDAALAKFDSDDFQTREQAAKDLAALGQPAAPALRMPTGRVGPSIAKAESMHFFRSTNRCPPMKPQSFATIRSFCWIASTAKMPPSAKRQQRCYRRLPECLSTATIPAQPEMNRLTTCSGKSSHPWQRDRHHDRSDVSPVHRHAVSGDSRLWSTQRRFQVIVHIEDRVQPCDFHRVAHA